MRQKLEMLFPSRPLSSGMFKPLWDPYARGRMLISENARFQHFFQFALIVGVLTLWWALARLYGVERWAIPLGLLFTLYFGPFSIAGFSMLSIQELPGTVLISLALLMAAKSNDRDESLPLIGSLVFVIAACLMKETFFSLLPAVLISIWSPRASIKRRATMAAIVTLLVLWPTFLNLFVKGAYSSGYSLNLAELPFKVIRAIQSFFWTYKFAVPILIVGLIIKFSRRDFSRFDLICMGGAIFYFGVLIPWTTEMGYYQGPMGPFLGFLVAQCILSIVRHWPKSVRAFVPTVMALSVLAAASIGRQAFVAQQFNEGLLDVKLYLVNHWKGEAIYTNGEEATETIPAGMSLIAGRTYPRFTRLQGAISLTPAYLAVYRSSRYPVPPLPQTSETIMTKGGWTLYFIP